MKIYLLEDVRFKADGGTMFGVVPKSMWSKHYPCNENNLCDCPVRSLLIITDNKKILVDTGIGNKQSEKYYSYQHIHGDYTLEKSLNLLGYTREDITDVIHTHLHYDHCGGSVIFDDNKNLIPAFKNAKYWVSKSQWENYLNCNPREAATYFPENMIPLKEKNLLHFIDADCEFYPNIELKHYNGHTIGLLGVHIKIEDKTFVFTSDFIPTSANIPLVWMASYDLQPLEVMKEKEPFLEEAVKNNYILLMQHDITTECCTLAKNEKGKIIVNQKFDLNSCF